MGTDHDDAGTPPAADALADQLLGRLLEEPDPAARWRALAELAGRLHIVRRVTVRQLLAEGLSCAEAGRVLGVSKGRVGQLAAGAPGPGAAEAWGRALAAAGLVAELGERGGSRRLRGERDRLVRAGLGSPAQRPAVEEAARRWAAAARRNRQGERAERLLERMNALLGRAADLPGRLPLAQRGEAVLGYHAERAGRAGSTATAD